MRIARQAAMNAATALCKSVNGSGKTSPDAKALLEVLKVSGAYDVDAVDPGQALAEIMGRIGVEGADENN